jgi:UDP-N-acetyl-D-mannosaminuronic acid dehydrogenase
MSICVHGLGYIGLATASLFANNGHEVTGFDVDDEVIDQIRRGEPNVSEPAMDTYVTQALSNGLTVSEDAVAADYHLICVPTPYDQDNQQAVLSYVEQAGRNTADKLRPGDTVVLESTVPPGTTTGLFSQALSRDGLTPGADFHLGYTPETVMPGNTVTELRTNDRIVGGITQESTEIITALYGDATDSTVYEAPNPTTAEFVKLAQNAARDVEIAYANTLARVADDYDIDVRKAIELANTHRRVDILNPGPGVGGHCLPVDPLFLSRQSTAADLIDCAREVNDQMSEYVIDQLATALGTLDDATVAVLGVAYKGNVSDTRNSPGLAIAGSLGSVQLPHPPVADGGNMNTTVRIHDPHVKETTLDLLSLDETVTDADAIVIAAGHDEFTQLDPDRIGQQLARKIVIDPVALLDRRRWTSRGFEIVGL